MNITTSSRCPRLMTFRSVLLLLLLLVTAACSSQKNIVEKTEFFPPPPDTPRLQYLTSFEDSGFIDEAKSTFKLVLTGSDRADNIIKILKPLGITTYKGAIYVVDTYQATVFLIDPAKNRFEAIRGNAGSGILKKPVNLAADEQGNIYVADVKRKEVLIYTADGDFVKAIGKDFSLGKPVGVAVNKENIFILDNATSTIKMVSRSDGQLVSEFGQGTSENDSLYRPYGLTSDAGGGLYITNTGTCKVLKFDQDGHTLLSFGGFGDALGEFSRPRNLAVDWEGRIWVVDAAFQNVQIFNSEAKLLMFFGDPGLPRGSMNLPAGIAITRDNLEYYKKFADKSFELEALVFITNQSGPNKVSVYGFGHSNSASPGVGIPVAPDAKSPESAEPKSVPASPPVK